MHHSQSPPPPDSTSGRRSSKLWFKNRFSRFLSPANSNCSSHQSYPSRSPSIGRIQDGLPIRFQQYANPVHSSYGFWKEHVLSLDKKERRLLETRFICKMFIAVPDIQPQMIEHNLAHVGQRVFSTIQWLLKTLYKGDMSKLIQRLEAITTSLKETLPNIESNHVNQAWHIFHDVFAEYFGDDLYSLQIRASFERLLSMAVDIAKEEDFLAQETRIQSDIDFDGYMQSVESCLQHPLGKKYLQLFMRSQWNEELYLFHMSHSQFKGSYGRTMIEFADTIMEQFIADGSPNQINISHDARLAAMKRHSNDIITSNMFDEAHSEVMRLLQGGIWKDFKRTMNVLHCSEKKLPQKALKLLQGGARSAPIYLSDTAHTQRKPLALRDRPNIQSNDAFEIAVDNVSRSNSVSEMQLCISPPSNMPENETTLVPFSVLTEQKDALNLRPIREASNSSIHSGHRELSHTLSIPRLSGSLSVPRLSGSLSMSRSNSICRRSQELSSFLTPKAGWMAGRTRKDNDFIPLATHQSEQYSNSSQSAEIFIFTTDYSEDDDRMES